MSLRIILLRPPHTLVVLELSVEQSDFELRDLPASASQVLGLKVCATMPGFDGKSKCGPDGGLAHGARAST